MFDLCLFDLDDTLLRTSDLDVIRRQGIGRRNDAEYRRLLIEQFGDVVGRYNYTPEHLNTLRSAWPDMKFGVFTRAPYAYARTLCNLAYPGFRWHVAVCYEDVRDRMYKPNGWGIRHCMERMSIADPRRVLMVGDESADIKAAYHAGCWAVLDRTLWPYRWDSSKHWAALELMPDAEIYDPGVLREVMENISAYLPCLESRLDWAAGAGGRKRFLTINHFYDRGAGEPPNSKESINFAGRHFSDYECLDNRRAWHHLTASIHDNKQSTSFPVEWIEVVADFISNSYGAADFFRGGLTVAAIPARPGRVPRLQSFIRQIESHFASGSINGIEANNLTFSVDLLAYRGAVRSQSGDFLNRQERFANVRDNLYVADVDAATGRNFLIIDDVCTSGATLMYAKKRLLAAGARDVKLLALSKNVGNIFQRRD